MSPAAASPVSRESIYAEVRLNRQLRRLENEGGMGWPLIIGIAASIALHASLLIPQVRDLLLAASNGASSASKARQAAFSVEKEMEKPPALTAEEEEQLIKLGIEDGTTKSTMTWIGYKDYQEHLAKLSQVDQAAFRESETGGQPMEAQPEQAPAAMAQSAPPAPPAENPPGPLSAAQPAVPPTATAPAPTTPEAQAQEAQQAVQPPPLPASLALPETPKVPNAGEKVPLADERKIEEQVLPVERVGDAKDAKVPPEPLKTDPPPPPDAKPTDLKPNDLKPNEAKNPEAKPAEDKSAEAKPVAKPDPAKPVEQPPTPQQPAAATSPPTQASPDSAQPANQQANPSPQQPASQPGSKPGPPSNGEVSDRESEASSTVDVPPAKWRNGRPLAAKGLNVRTQRPIFDELTSVTTAPTNPIIEIEFDREGVPKKCTILQSSGTPLVDQPILDCLYRWRASGSQLTKLPEGQTLKFRIRMLLR
ncbi:MAG: hypothetical protein K8R92_11165 [Planctomycetes bacterium]|nr:hypothetical protein [Planctomycetota bacterium]